MNLEDLLNEEDDDELEQPVEKKGLDNEAIDAILNESDQDSEEVDRSPDKPFEGNILTEQEFHQEFFEIN